MPNKIFYFSSTGNSLAFARSLAVGLGDTELIPIARALADPEFTDVRRAARVGLVFPVLTWGAPRMVSEFVARLEVSAGQYVFAVATCGGVPGNTVRRIGRRLRSHGGHLDAGFVVRERDYHQAGAQLAIRLVHWAAGEVRPKTGSERLSEITAMIRGFRGHPPETGSLLAGLLGDLFNVISIRTTKTADGAFRASERCAGCGVCERICPRANVRVVGKPRWQGDCDFCQACLQWCPQHAIHIRGAPSDTVQGHRPGITRDQMMLR